MTHRSNPHRLLFLKIKYHNDTATLIHIPVVCDSCHATVAEFSSCNTYQCPPKPNRFAVWTFAAKFCWAPHESNLPSVELMMVLSCQYPSVVSSSLGIVLLQCHWILYSKTWFGKQTCFSKYMLYDVLLILSTVKQYARQYNRCFIFIKCISQLHCS